MFTTFQKAVIATIAGSAVLIGLVLAARGSLVAAAVPTVVTSPSNGGIAPGVVTVGDATVKIKPDIAILTVGATAQAATAADAQARVAERIDRMLNAAKALGIADKDTKTAGYTIVPQYAYDRGAAPRITGYQATETLSLTLRKIDDAGKALDALVQGDGATSARIAFFLDDPKNAQAQARKLAIDDARAKADAMAAAAGVRLGGVIAITDSSPNPTPYTEKVLDAVAPAMVPTQIPVGELEVVVRVQVQFQIQ